MSSSPTLQPVAPTRLEKPAADEALLPPLLLGPSAFFWFWVLPIAVLAALNLQGYWLIEGNLSVAEKAAAHQFGWFGAVNLLLGLISYGVGGILVAIGSTPKARHPTWAIGAVLVQVAYLWISIDRVNTFLPGNVRTWLYPEERFIWNQFAFAMMPLFLGLLRLAASRPRSGNFGRALLVSLVAACGAPLALYLSFNLLRFIHWERGMAVIIAVEVILCSVIMFVGLIRVILTGLSRIQARQCALELWAIGVFALGFPLGGLWLNTSIPFPVDLQAWEVYALTLANASLLFFTSLKREYKPRVSYGLLCATLPFSLYFFIVFLPFTPLSILAVIALGAGFLVLSPVLLFALHLHLLNRARKAVLAQPKGSRAAWLCASGLLLLPAIYTGRALADRAALHAALDYVYAPNLSSARPEYSGSRLNLRRALANHRDYKDGIYYPLLSPYYSWLVFDNLVLPDEKLNRLEKTFFGEEPRQAAKSLGSGQRRGDRTVRDRTLTRRAPPMPQTARVAKLALQSRSLDADTQIITLGLTLENTGAAPAEYVQALPLPAGLFVKGFRLEMNGEMTPGRIFEKKTAAWVYSMIRDSERRDPGLLVYTDAHTLELRAFPIATQPIRVEIDFVAPSAVNASAAPQSNDPVEVLRALEHTTSPTLGYTKNGAIFLPGDSATLPAVDAPTYLHLIIDVSQENGYTGSIDNAIRLAHTKYPGARRARISVANYENVDVTSALTPIDELLTRAYGSPDRVLPRRGSLAADLAVSRALRQHLELDLERTDPDALPPRPIVVLMNQRQTHHAPDLTLAENWAEGTMDFEVDELDASGNTTVLRPAATTSTPLVRLGHAVRPILANHATRFERVTAADTLRYWSPDAQSWSPLEITRVAPQTPWTDAAGLVFAQQDYSRSPGSSSMTAADLIMASRAQSVLIPSASFIVVENSAQWRQLELSEKTKLGQNAALEFRETPAPPTLWLIAAFALWLGLRKLRRTAHFVPQTRPFRL